MNIDLGKLLELAPTGATHYLRYESGYLVWLQLGTGDNEQPVLREWDSHNRFWVPSIHHHDQLADIGLQAISEQAALPTPGNDDLTWLVRESRGEWFGSHPTHIARDGDLLTWATFPRLPEGYHWFTKAEYLARRAELQSKPSWKEAPAWAEWLAQDKHGDWWWHKQNPEITEDGFDSTCAKESNTGEVLGDWRDTLERRPEPATEDAVVLAAQDPLTSRHDWFERGELPPVGTVCEASADGCEPEKCEILAYHQDSMALRWFEFKGGCLDVLHLDGWSFRPIRTERDELLSLITSNLSGTAGQVADAILAAGFKWGERKNRMDAKEDWQAVSTWPDFTLEVDCNSGRYRRVYRDGRIEMEG